MTEASLISDGKKIVDSFNFRHELANFVTISECVDNSLTGDTIVCLSLSLFSTIGAEKRKLAPRVRMWKVWDCRQFLLDAIASQQARMCSNLPKDISKGLMYCKAQWCTVKYMDVLWSTVMYFETYCHTVKHSAVLWSTAITVVCGWIMLAYGCQLWSAVSMRQEMELCDFTSCST